LPPEFAPVYESRKLTANDCRRVERGDQKQTGRASGPFRSHHHPSPVAHRRPL